MIKIPKFPKTKAKGKSGIAETIAGNIMAARQSSKGKKSYPKGK